MRKFVMLDSDLAESAGQLTPTRKARRDMVMEQYATQISSLRDKGDA